MNHTRRLVAFAGVASGPIALAVLALSLAACSHAGSSSSSSGTTAASIQSALASNPALTKQLTGTEAREIAHLKACLPAGSASAVDAVMAGHASVQTAFQLSQAFQGTNLAQVEAKCIPGGGSHPMHLFDGCFKGHAPHAIENAIKAAVQPYQMHPIKDRHLVVAASAVATSQTTVRVAAVCLNDLTK